MFNLEKKCKLFFFEVLFFKMTLALSLFFILWNSIILFKMWITFLEEKMSKGAHLGVAGVQFAFHIISQMLGVSFFLSPSRFYKTFWPQWAPLKILNIQLWIEYTYFTLFQ